ncbi:MAG: hypothetical protein HY399_00600 [Elusimicrobia bacterium]|nr:hypothetical protein [Elusimicrobiota bacterium]
MDLRSFEKLLASELLFQRILDLEEIPDHSTLSRYQTRMFRTQQAIPKPPLILNATKTKNRPFGFSKVLF